MTTWLDRLVWALHQKLVDVSQRKPKWWAETCSEILVIAAPYRSWTNGYESWGLYVALFFDLLLITSFWFLTHSPVGWDVMRKAEQTEDNTRFRRAFLVYFILLALFFFRWPAFISLLVMISPSYFALCDDPKPREPRTRAVPQT